MSPADVDQIGTLIEDARFLRDEVIAWRNRFPDFAYKPGECRIVEVAQRKPELPGEIPHRMDWLSVPPTSDGCPYCALAHPRTCLFHGGTGPVDTGLNAAPGKPA